MRENFIKREKENDGYLLMPTTPEPGLSTHFNFEFGYGEIKPVYLVHLDQLLPAWRQELARKNSLLEQEFKIDQLSMSGGEISYCGITAENIVFCDGTGSFHSKYFGSLPFAPNKGEALIVRIPGLPASNIFKKSSLMVPLGDDHFWVGSNYLWDFEDDRPSDSFREKTEQQIREWIKLPYTVVDHLAGIRPATLERRPFVGMHPVWPRIGILNGMGTKGCSLAPYFARQLSNHLTTGETIMKEASLSRFRNLLSR